MYDMILRYSYYVLMLFCVL